MGVTLLRAEGLLMICLTFLLLLGPFSVYRIEHFSLLQQPVWSVQGGGFARKDRIYLICTFKNVEPNSLTGLQNQHFSKKKKIMVVVFSAPNLKAFLTLSKVL